MSNAIFQPFGELPSDWKYGLVKENVDYLTGPAFDSEKFNTEGRGIRLVRGINLTKGATRWHAEKTKYWDSELDQLIKYELIESDILIGMDGSLVGKNYAYLRRDDLPALLVQRVARLRAKGYFSSKFLYFLFGTDEWLTYVETVKTSSGIPHISNGDIKSFHIPTPPLPEQQEIAKILTSVDEVIEKTQAQIDKLKDLKTGMMQELLTNGIGHTEFKDSPVGRIPAEWEVKTLDKIISTMDGGVSVNSENKPKSSGQFGILKTSSIAKGKFFPSENKVVLPHEIERLKTPVLADHIIFSRMNTPALVGESGYILQNHDDLFLPDRLWQIDVKCRKETNVLWLSYVLASNKLKAEISELATGTSNTMKNISKPKLLSIKVACPKFEEQVKIAKSLKSIDTKIDLISSKLEKSKNTKKALMQDLLTGKVRVKVDS